MSLLILAAEATIRGLSGARAGARLLGHDAESLNRAHQIAAPVRSRLSQEHMQELAEQMGSVQPAAPVDSGSTIDGTESVGGGDGETGGGLFGDAIDWLLNFF